MTDGQRAVMRRDMDLVRRILIAAEGKHPREVTSREFVDENTSEATVAYHFRLMSEANLIEASILGLERVGPMSGTVIQILWEGHEFLDAVRSEEIWARTKDTSRKVGGSLTFELVKALAVKLLTSAVGLS
jgi:Hypothetical protein (DUF2513)